MTLAIKRVNNLPPRLSYVSALPDNIQEELSYRKQIARQLRTQYVEDIHRPKYYTVTLKSRLRVTQAHWKRNRWTDHTRITVESSYLTLHIIVTLKCGLEVIQGH